MNAKTKKTKSTRHMKPVQDLSPLDTKKPGYFFPVEEVAKMLGVTPAGVHNICSRDGIAPKQLGNRFIYDADTVRTIAEAQLAAHESHCKSIAAASRARARPAPELERENIFDGQTREIGALEDRLDLIQGMLAAVLKHVAELNAQFAPTPKPEASNGEV